MKFLNNKDEILIDVKDEFLIKSLKIEDREVLRIFEVNNNFYAGKV